MYCSKEPVDDFSKSIRGVIFENDVVVHRGLPYSEDVDVNDDEKIDFLLSENFRACLSHEGTVVRMIYFGAQWNMTTHRRLDATKSRWGNARPFGLIFKDKLSQYFSSYEAFLENLDKNKHYHFLLKATDETRIVVFPDQKESIILTAISCAATFDILPLEPVGGIPVSQSLSFSDSKAVREFVLGCDPFAAQGVMFFSGDMQQSFRVANPEYLKFVSVRDNISSLSQCYACQRLKQEKELFFKLYPNGESIGRSFEEKFDAIALELHRIYLARHVDRRKIHVSQLRHKFLTTVHKFYKTSAQPQNLDIRIFDIKNLLNKLNPFELHKLVTGRDKFVTQKP